MCPPSNPGIEFAPRMGNHKGCPYDELVEAYFRGNDKCHRRGSADVCI